MPLQSRVEWVGLTKMIEDIANRSRVRWPQGCIKLTRKWANKVHKRYVENLSGSAPSTSEKPLPVGVRSGDLRAGAKTVIINQYKFREENDVPYSGFIEDGTVKMTPRRPLGNAVFRTQDEAPGDMNEVLVEVWRV